MGRCDAPGAGLGRLVGSRGRRDRACFAGGRGSFLRGTRPTPPERVFHNIFTGPIQHSFRDLRPSNLAAPADPEISTATTSARSATTVAAAPMTGAVVVIIGGTRQTPPDRTLPRQRFSATPRISSNAGSRPPRSTSHSPPCASSPPKPPLTAGSPRWPPPGSAASPARAAQASGPATG